MSKVITKQDLNKVFWRGIFMQFSWNYERMQALGYCWTILPVLKKIYKDDSQGLKSAVTRNLEFFNTHPYMAMPIMGISLAMEEAASDGEEVDGNAISSVKVALMGPLAGIGDTISWSTLMYLFIGLFLPLAKQGNPLGGIGPIVLLTVICFGIGYFLTSKCYTFGYSFAENMLKSGLVNMIITGASILGLFMMGGLAATYVTVSTPIKFVTSTYTTTLQSILNSIAPGILPLIVVLCIWGYLAKVKRNYFAATLGVTIISLVLGCIGIII